VPIACGTKERERERERACTDRYSAVSLALTTLSEHCVLPPVVYALSAQALSGVKSVSDYGSILSNHDAAS